MHPGSLHIAERPSAIDPEKPWPHSEATQIVQRPAPVGCWRTRPARRRCSQHRKGRMPTSGSSVHRPVGRSGAQNMASGQPTSRAVGRTCSHRNRRVVSLENKNDGCNVVVAQNCGCFTIEGLVPAAADLKPLEAGSHTPAVGQPTNEQESECKQQKCDQAGREGEQKMKQMHTLDEEGRNHLNIWD
jgi:hypothetical protein